MFKKITLKNGLRIITIPQSNTQAVTVFTLIGTGSKYEKKNISGISHFLEHLFFKGTKKRPTALKVIEPLDKVGGIYNAFTGEEFTGFYAKVTSSKLDLALDWISEIYFDSLFSKKEMEKERKVIIEEINMGLDIPMKYIGDLWKKLLYGDQPAGWNIVGNKETVSKISRQQVLNYKESQYTASNTIVCVAGNFNEIEVLNKIKKYFSKISSLKSMKKVRVIERQTVPRCLTYFKKTDQSHFCLGVRAYNLFHPKRYVLEVMANLLGGSGMMSSRLFTELREKHGLAYYIKTEADQDTDTGYLVTSAGVDNKRIEQAIKIILKEYRDISHRKVSLKELKKAKDNLKGRLALGLESSDANAMFYSIQELLEKKVLKLEEIFKRIDKVSANDILKVAKDIFKLKNLNLAIIGPFEDQERFRKLLKL